MTHSLPRGAIDARWLAERVDGTRPVDIRRDIAGLVTDRVLETGLQLPTVRDVAAELGVSVGTVSSAWAQLQRDGVLVTRRRGGTTVARWRADDGSPSTDLVGAPADPALLPELRRSIELISQKGRSGGTLPIAPELRRSIERRWPYRPPALLAVPGARSALHLVIAALLETGAPIATVDPLCQRTADVLRTSGHPTLPVAEDEHGPVPKSLAAALTAGARLFCFEPTLSVPTGTSLSPGRAKKLAAVIRAAPAGVLVFEEDTGAALVDGISLGEHVPDRVLRVTPYARAYGADLAIAVLSGPVNTMAQLARLQADQGTQVGVFTQRLLARLLIDRSAASRTRTAADTYLRRNLAMRNALNTLGVDVAGDGYFVWVRVVDEAQAVRTLASRGILAEPGARSRLASSGAPHIRLGTTRVPDGARELSELAALIAHAAQRKPATRDD
jgi:DNA-binding transcriptional MocR family regulator